MHKKLLGEILVDMGIVTREMITECLNKQIEVHQKSNKMQPIGKLLMKRGYITSKQLEAALEQQSKNKMAN